MKRFTLRKLSGKRRKQVNEYLKARRKYLAENMVCKMCGEAQATQIHHRAGRTGERLLKEEWWIACCQNCHSFAHSHPEASMKAGWLLHRTDNL